MSTRYIHKSEAEMAWAANRKRLLTEARIILDSMMNDALAEASKRFNEAYGRGTIAEIAGSRDELKSLLLASAQKELAPGNAS